MTKEQIIKDLTTRYARSAFTHDADVTRTLIAQDLNNDYMDELMELANDDYEERESIASEIESDVIDNLEELEDEELEE